MDNISIIPAILFTSINNEILKKSCKKSALLSPVSIEDFSLVPQGNPDRVSQAFEEYIMGIQALKQELSEITDDKTYSQTRNVLSVFVSLLFDEKYESNENSPEMVWRAMGIFDSAGSNNEDKFRGRVEELVFHETIALTYCGNEYSAFAREFLDGVSGQTERAYFEAKGKIYSNILSTAKLFRESFGSVEYIARCILKSPDTLLSDPESLCRRIADESKERNKSVLQKNKPIKNDTTPKIRNDLDVKNNVKKDSGFSLCALSPFSSIVLTYCPIIYTSTIHFVMRYNIKQEKSIFIRQIKVRIGGKESLTNQNTTLLQEKNKATFDVIVKNIKVHSGDTVRVVMKCSSGTEYTITFSFADCGRMKLLNESFSDSSIEPVDKPIPNSKSQKRKTPSKSPSKKQVSSQTRGFLSCGESLAYRAYVNTQVNNKEISEIKPVSKRNQYSNINFSSAYYRPKFRYQFPKSRCSFKVPASYGTISRSPKKQMGGIFQRDPRKSQLTFRRSSVNPNTLICPVCGNIVDNDCMKYNMFWKCERCGFSEGIK